MIPTDRPADRAKEVTIDLVSDKSLPNILLGAFLTATIQYAAGMVSFTFAAVSGAIWLLSVAVYAVAEHVKQRIEEERNRLLDEESEYKGIE